MIHLYFLHEVVYRDLLCFPDTHTQAFHLCLTAWRHLHIYGSIPDCSVWLFRLFPQSVTWLCFNMFGIIMWDIKEYCERLCFVSTSVEMITSTFSSNHASLLHLRCCCSLHLCTCSPWILPSCVTFLRGSLRCLGQPFKLPQEYKESHQQCCLYHHKRNEKHLRGQGQVTVPVVAGVQQLLFS